MAERPVLIVAPGAGLPDPAALQSHYEVVRFSRSGNDDVLGLDDLVDRPAALRFALPVRRELLALIKPRLLRNVLGRFRGREVVFLDGDSLVNHPPLFEDPLESTLELVPRLPLWLARYKGSLDVGLGLGLGEPTGDLLRLRPGDEIEDLLQAWQEFLESAYVRNPSGSLIEAERRFLGILPALHGGVAYTQGRAYGLWCDLHDEGPEPRVIGTEGLAEHLSDEGPAFWLMERRTHSVEAIDRVVDRYRRALAAADSGASGDRLTRDIFRAVDPRGSRWPDPSDDGVGGFRQWLTAVDSRGLPRFAQALYWARPDLQEAFPARQTSARIFAGWLASQGVGVGEAERSARPPLLARARRGAIRRVRRALGRGEATLASPRRVAAPLSGVNVVGYLTSDTGLGVAARGTARAMADLGLPLSVVDLSGETYSVRRQSSGMGEAVGTPYDLSVFQVNPGELLHLRTEVLMYRFSGSYHVGFWAWETDRFPQQWLPAFDMVDEVWTPSHFVAEVIGRETDKPTRVMGHPVEIPAELRSDRDRFGIPPDHFTVVFVTDALSALPRKNPLGAIEAFDRAFGPGFEEVHLVLKVSNLDKFPAYRKRLKGRAAGRPVTVIEEHLDPAGLWSLLASGDVYLSLHTCEGFGLTILEAMACGKPAVVTRYGGNLDYTDESNSLLVDYRLLEITDPEAGIYRDQGRWAEPDLDQASRLLRDLRADGSLRERLGTAARLRAREFAPDRYAQRIGERLAEIGVTETPG